MEHLSTWIEVGTIVTGLVGGWFTLRAQVASLKTSVDALSKVVGELEDSGVVQSASRAERGLAALHRRVDEHDRQIAVLENDGKHHAKQLEDGLARIEASVALLHRRFDVMLGNGGGGR